MSVQIKGVGTIGGIDQGLNTVGVVTATSFSGSGANLTNLPSQVSITGNADNRVITGGSGVNLNGEANLTFDGSKLGVNRTPTRTFHVTSDDDLTSFTGTSYGTVAIENSQYDSGDYNAIDFTYSGSNNPVARIAAKITGGGSSLHFGTSNNYASGITNEALSISLGGDVSITDGNLIVASGHGIDFSSTGDASGMSNELLDDYEEGSWTPTILGWDTFTHYSGSSYYAGWYVKVGGMVHCGWKIYYQNLSTPSSNAHIRISGLPYAAKSISAGPVSHVRFDIPDFSFSGYPVPYLAGNDTTIGFYKQVNGSNNISAINATSNYSNNWTMGTATYATN